MLYVIILIIPLLIYTALSAFILFHLKRYGIAGDLTQKIIILFFIVSAALIFFTVWSFFNVPWNELNLTDMIQNTLNNNPVFYQQ